MFVTTADGGRLLHNNGGGKFTDVTSGSGIRNTIFAVSAAWLDYDKDGRLDLFVGNYVEWSPAVEAEMNAALRRMREPVRQELSRGMAAGEFRGVDIQHADEMIWQSYQHGLRAVSVNGGTPAMAVPQVFKTLEALSA